MQEKDTGSESAEGHHKPQLNPAEQQKSPEDKPTNMLDGVGVNNNEAVSLDQSKAENNNGDSGQPVQGSKLDAEQQSIQADERAGAQESSEDSNDKGASLNDQFKVGGKA